MSDGWRFVFLTVRYAIGVYGELATWSWRICFVARCMVLVLAGKCTEDFGDFVAAPPVVRRDEEGIDCTVGITVPYVDI